MRSPVCVYRTRSGGTNRFASCEIGRRGRRALPARRRPARAWDDAAHVGAQPHHLRVDRVLHVPPTPALQHLAVPGHQQDLVRTDLFEPEPGRLHPHAATFGVARGHVYPDQVVLIGRPRTRQPNDTSVRSSSLLVSLSSPCAPTHTSFGTYAIKAVVVLDDAYTVREPRGGPCVPRSAQPAVHPGRRSRGPGPGRRAPPVVARCRCGGPRRHRSAGAPPSTVPPPSDVLTAPPGAAEPRRPGRPRRNPEPRQPHPPPTTPDEGSVRAWHRGRVTTPALRFGRCGWLGRPGG